MGWDGWNKFECNVSQNKLLHAADAIVESGMRDAGYSFVTVDDCWALPERDEYGRLVADPDKFPDGMQYLQNELSSRNIGMGIYTSHARQSCQHGPGSYDHEALDAQTFADMGVVLVKNDWCADRIDLGSVPDDAAAFVRMRDALNKTGKSIIYSIHWRFEVERGPGCQLNTTCALPNIANMWRVSGDIHPSWDHVLRQIDAATPLAAEAGPGKWNDLDMLEVGNGMTTSQDEAHFTMWCMLASPLIAGNDPRRMSTSTKRILTNKHAIAVNQDALGKQAIILATEGDVQIWLKQLAEPDGSWALALLNRGSKKVNDVTVNFGSIANVPFKVLDLWDNAKSLGTHTELTTDLKKTSAKMYKLVPHSSGLGSLVKSSLMRSRAQAFAKARRRHHEM
jgi:alpha-galactosidase